MKINYELKELRASRNISQRKLAKVLNMTASTYNRKENGLRSFTIDEAKSIADFFNKSIEKVFFKSHVTK